MQDIVSLNSLLSLPDDILASADKYGSLLQRDFYSNYDVKTIKAELMVKFNKFKNIKCSYDFPVDSNFIKSPSLMNQVNSSSLSYGSRVEQLVTKSVDNQIWVTNFYLLLLNVAKKLTREESNYLVLTFFVEESEEQISEELSISRSTLQKIKKSCLVKLWFELKKI